MKQVLLITCGILLWSVSGCHYYQEYRGLKGDADLKEERTELMKAQRECVQRYESDPEEAEKHCGIYQEMIRNLGL